MRPSLIKKLCCPFDKEELDIKIFVKDTEENIIEGLLTCPHCKRYYPIAYGVPIMTPDEYRELSLEAPLLKRWEHQLEDNHTEATQYIASLPVTLIRYHILCLKSVLIMANCWNLFCYL